MAGEAWETRITKVDPDKLLISGYPLKDLVRFGMVGDIVR